MQGAESCFATQELARAIEARLHRPVLVSASKAELSVEGTVHRTVQGWHVSLRVRDEHGGLTGEREIDFPGASCSVLEEPLPLVIALMIDPEAQEPAEPPPSPKPAAQITPAPRVEVRRETVYVPVPANAPREPAWHFEGGVGLATGAGQLPSPNVGAAASALLTPPHWPTFEAHGTVWRDARPDSDAALADISRWDAGLALCPLATLSEGGTLALCTGGQLALLSSSGLRGDAGTSTFFVPEWVLIGRGSLVLIEPFVLRAGLSVFAPLRRPGIPGAREETVFRSYWIGGAVDFGIGVRFR